MSSIKFLIFLPNKLPPGSLVFTNFELSLKRPLVGIHLEISSIWVVLPQPSIPSITINLPLIQSKDKAFITTVIELVAINNAAIDGVRRIPYFGNRIPAAIGIAIKL